MRQVLENELPPLPPTHGQEFDHESANARGSLDADTQGYIPDGAATASFTPHLPGFGSPVGSPAPPPFPLTTRSPRASHVRSWSQGSEPTQSRAAWRAPGEEDGEGEDAGKTLRGVKENVGGFEAAHVADPTHAARGARDDNHQASDDLTKTSMAPSFEDEHGSTHHNQIERQSNLLAQHRAHQRQVRYATPSPQKQLAWGSGRGELEHKKKVKRDAAQAKARAARAARNGNDDSVHDSKSHGQTSKGRTAEDVKVPPSERVEDRLFRDWVIRQARQAAKEEAARQADLTPPSKRKPIRKTQEELEAAGESLYLQGLERQARRTNMHLASPPQMRAGMSPRGMGDGDVLTPRGMTNVSRVIMSNAHDFIRRQEHYEARRKETLQAEARRRKEDEEKQVKRAGKPKITLAAKSMTRTVEDLSSWAERKKMKQAEAKARLLEVAAAETTFAPRITEKSRRLAMEREARILRVYGVDGRGGVEGSNTDGKGMGERQSVADSAHSNGALSEVTAAVKEVEAAIDEWRLPTAYDDAASGRSVSSSGEETAASTARRASEQGMLLSEAAATFSPTITSKAAKMVRPGKVGDRLWEISTQPKKHRGPRGVNAHVYAMGRGSQPWSTVKEEHLADYARGNGGAGGKERDAGRVSAEARAESVAGRENVRPRSAPSTVVKLANASGSEVVYTSAESTGLRLAPGTVNGKPRRHAKAHWWGMDGLLGKSGAVGRERDGSEGTWGAYGPSESGLSAKYIY